MRPYSFHKLEHAILSPSPNPPSKPLPWNGSPPWASGRPTDPTSLPELQPKFRVHYDRIVSFDPYDGGFGIMRDAQAAKPQTFRTGDSWFAYNLAANLGQLQE